MRKVLVVLALLLCLPMFGSAQSINYYPGRPDLVLYSSESDRSTSGTSEELLYTMTIPFPDVGYTVDFLVRGVHAANTNNALFTLRAGQNAGNPLANTTLGSTVSATSAGVMLNVQSCTRVSSSELLCWRGEYYAPAVTGAGLVLVTGLNFASPVTVSVSATTATSAGDVTVKYIRAQAR
jgi:hypothetical protein